MSSHSISTKKSGVGGGNGSIGNISKVLEIINSAMKIPRQPSTPLPPPLIMSGAKLRPGISSKEITGNIISRQSEAGAPVGDATFDSTENISESMERIRVEEIVNAVLTQAKVDVVIPPGVQVSTVGIGNYGAPVISQGATTNMAIGDGIIR